MWVCDSLFIHFPSLLGGVWGGLHKDFGCAPPPDSKEAGLACGVSGGHIGNDNKASQGGYLWWPRGEPGLPPSPGSNEELALRGRQRERPSTLFPAKQNPIRQAKTEGFTNSDSHNVQVSTKTPCRTREQEDLKTNEKQAKGAPPGCRWCGSDLTQILEQPS